MLSGERKGKPQSTFYKKAEPKIKVLAGISVGGLELVATRSIKDLSELKGQTVYLTERGTLVELLLKYLVNLYGIDPFNELSFEYATDNIELINMLSENEASFALFSSADANYVKANVENLSSYNLTDEFAKKFKNPSIVDYCVIATEDFIKENPKATNQLIKDIEASVKKSSDISKTLSLAKNQKLLTRDYTEEFLTSCKADFICGEQMQKKISAYCNLLFKIKRSLIGGEVPKDDFYYVSQNL